MEGNREVPVWRRTWVILLLILLLAGFLRLVKLGQSPPGLNQDEAANAWNAYCLLKTGKDQVGVSWPIFYTRALGGNRSTLHIYLLIPFQAIGGLNIITTRLPAAVGGVLTVLLIYYVGRRLFGREVGLVSAFLLALNPWHLQQSRWGHDAALGALFGLVPLATMLWASLPISDEEGVSPRPIRAGIAGAVTGICCYGYHAVRLFIPVFLVVVILLNVRRWWRCLRTRRGALAIVCFFVLFALTFGPLVWQHIYHPEGIGRHGQYLDKTGSLIGSGPFGVALKNTCVRYLQHFGPDFLFVQGDLSSIYCTPGAGQYRWYMLPLMVLGLIALVVRAWLSASARVLLAFVIMYPVGDCLYVNDVLQILRSSPGLCSLVLLAAFGGVAFVRLLWRWQRIVGLAIVVVFGVAVAGLNVRYLHHFYTKYNEEPDVYHVYNGDLIEAYEWLRPRFDEVEAVFCTTTEMNMPYVISLVVLGYEPEVWFEGVRKFGGRGEWDYCSRYGKIRFMAGSSFNRPVRRYRSKSAGRAVFIVRPNEGGLKNPVHRIVNPVGEETLWICEY